MTNDGLGPAIIKSAGVTIDARRLPTLDAAITVIVPNRKRVNGTTSVSNITVGSVIRAGQTIVLMDMKGIGFARPLREHLSHVDRPDLLLFALTDVLDRARHRRAAPGLLVRVIPAPR